VSSGAGESIARRFFALCENPRTRGRMIRVLQSSADSAVGGRLLVAVLSRVVFAPMLRSRRVDLVRLVSPGLQATLDA
jgi:hypothetical protein